MSVDRPAGSLRAWLAQSREDYRVVHPVTAWLLALFATVQVVTLPLLSGADVAELGVERQGPEFSLGFAIYLVVATVVVGALYLLIQRLPEWLRELALRAGKVLLGLGSAAVAVWAATRSPTGFGIVALCIGIMAALDYLGIDLWLFNHNAYAFLFAIFGTVLLAVWVTPVAAATLLVLTAIVDYVEVSKTSIMRRAVLTSLAVRIPNYFVLPSRRDLELGAAREWARKHALDDAEAGDKPAGLAAILGGGDVVFPIAFVGSIAVATQTVWTPLVVLPALGILAAIPALVGSMDGGVPGLPHLNGGALAGLAVALPVQYVLDPALLEVVLS